MQRLISATFAVVVTVASVCQGQVSSSTPAASAKHDSSSVGAPGTQPPNILFIIMDDVGIDQMAIFGYGGNKPPSTPNINTIADVGVKFMNTWAMPECSPSRAIFFEGRYPLRTNIFSAILSDDLANSQVSPFEATTPKVLKSAHYLSGLFGKFHLAGPDNNPFGYGTPHALGWDYFDGFLEGSPYPIDTTIGGQFPADTYSCGFVNDAATGACRFADDSCKVISKGRDNPNPGRSCMEMGGLFVPNTTCTDNPPSLNFKMANAYYVWHRVYNQPDGTVIQVPLTDPRARGYVSEATTAAASDWIKAQNSHRPWMATVAYANIHTPYQQPPASLLPMGSTDTSNYKCTVNDTKNLPDLRTLSDQMLEAMDTEIGNLLVQSGLATRNGDGTLHYDPQATNTMVIIIGDNGTFAPGVKQPFDPSRAKGWVYQTGVWVPLIVSGPLVTDPGKTVMSMINVADLFQLFGEIAGLDVRKVVPASHILDSVSMLPYLTNPDQSIRKSNFTQMGNNIHPNDVAPPPCVLKTQVGNKINATCIQLFNEQAICDFEGGDWYGPGAPQPYPSCCAVQAANLPQYPDLNIFPDAQWATRNYAANGSYKLVRKSQPNCVDGQQDGDITFTEFYPINEAAPTPLLDKAGAALCSDDMNGGNTCPMGLNDDQKTAYTQLQDDLQSTLDSETPCKGDGNEDRVVDGLDVLWWGYFASPKLGGGLSSWYDFNHDGLTNKKDLKVILQHFGDHCPPG